MNAWALGAADVGALGVVAVALVALAGALAIHALRRGRRVASMPPNGTEASPEDAEIAQRLRVVAARMGLPERVLPRACTPDGDGDFVWRDGAIFRYRSLERGSAMADHADDSLDGVLYHVFHDRTRMQAYLATVGSDETTREARIAEQQRALLALADPAWAERTP